MNDSLVHFSDWEWLELACRLTPPDRASEMHAHLAGGCENCGQLHKKWSLILQAAERQSEYEPPEDVVRSVKAAFSLAHKLPSLSRIAVAARLVFDSFREPLPAGIRGTTPTIRHLLHEVDDYVIDLRMERQSGGRIFIAGQTLPKEANCRDAIAAGIVVVAKSGDLVAQAIANSVGEFHLEFAEACELSVYVAISNESVIAIALPDAVESSPGN